MKSMEEIARSWFHWSGLVGIILSVLVFLLYGFGFLPTSLTAEESSAYWDDFASEFRKNSGVAHGRCWFLQRPDGFTAVTMALAVLASAPIPPLIALSVEWFRRKEIVFGILAVAIVTVLLLALIDLI